MIKSAAAAHERCVKSTNLVAQDQHHQEEVGVMQGVDVTMTTMRNDGSMRKEEGLELEENTQILPLSPGLRCRTGGGTGYDVEQVIMVVRNNDEVSR